MCVCVFIATNKILDKENGHLKKHTFSKAIDAVSPEVSMATTSGSGLATGRMCLEGT